MRSADFENAAKFYRRILTIIWLAMLAVVGVYVAVAYVATPVDADSELPEVVLLALTAVAISTGAMSLVIPSRLLGDARLRSHMTNANFKARRYASQAGAGEVNQAQRAAIEKLPEREQRIVTTASLYFVPFVVGVALAESVAIFGLVLAFLSGSPSIAIPYALASVGLLLIKRPNLEALFRRAESLG